MPWVGAAIGGVASIAGGMLSSSATSKAADQSAAVQREGLQQQRELADRSRADLMPFADAGRNALLMTSNLSGLNGPDAARDAMTGFTASPGYQTALEGGTRAIDRSAAARGMLRSGPTLQAVETFGQGLASADFGSWYNRLADLSKAGQAAAAGQQQASNVLSGQIGDANKGIAQTIMSAGGAQASIYGNMATGVGNSVTNGLSNYLYQQRVDAQQPRNALYSDAGAFGGAGTSAGGAENAGW